MQGQWRGDVPPYITSNFLSYTRHTRGRGFDPRQCLKLIRNSNLPSFGINCHKSRNLSFKFRQKLFYCKNCNLCTLLSTWLDLFFIFDTFNIATHSNSDATREASNMDIVSTVVGINGILRWKKSSAAVYTYQGLPPAVRRTRRWTLHYDAEMFNRLLMCNVIDCKMPCDKKQYTKRGRGWPILKKKSLQFFRYLLIPMQRETSKRS